MVEMAPSSNLGNQVLALAAAHRLGEVGERAATQVVFPHTRRMTLSGENNTDGMRTLPLVMLWRPWVNDRSTLDLQEGVVNAIGSIP
jgi:hypothetical protein